jgi:hypothetical protein
MESEDRIAEDVCHTDQATHEFTNAKHTPTEHGEVYYRFGNELSFLRRLFTITNGK